jgi:hypothetical protein
MSKKISFSTFVKNKQLYIDKVKNKNLTPYYHILSNEYEFDNKVDFSEFIDVMSQQEEKDVCRDILKKYKELGVKIEKEYLYDNNSWEDYYDYELSKSHISAIEKNEKLICDLADFRINALGIGTNKIKRRLNKISTTNVIAKALRLAIEIEDVNILAKKSFGKYKNKQYDKKSKLILDLVEIFKENGWIYGIQYEKNISTNHILYFEIPNTEQISFHTNLYNTHMYPNYKSEWDGKINSTYPKLLESVKNQFPEIIY